MSFCLVALMSGACVTATSAAALPVAVLNSTYTAFVGVVDNLGAPDTNSMVSSAPVSLTYDNLGPVEAQADAGTFEISAFTANLWPHNNALAAVSTEITFAPSTSGATTLDLEFYGANEWYYSDGSVSLFDATLNQTVWNYGWAYGQAGTVLWTVNNPGQWYARASVPLETIFDATHTYQLTMSTDTDANYDSQHILVQLSGLETIQPVPEPSTYALTGMGAAAWLMFHRRRASALRVGAR